jgi:DNA-binding NtrC family response regulator
MLVESIACEPEAFSSAAVLQLPVFPSISALVVSAESAHRDMLAASIRSIGLRPFCCRTHETAASLLRQRSFAIVFCDDLLPDGTFRAVMDEIARGARSIPMIVTSRLADWGPFLSALNAGAFDYIALPPLPGEVERIVSAALRECGLPGRGTAQTHRGTMAQAAS